MITEELKELVRNEADKLREHATNEERSKLDFKTMDHGHPELCPYGQMTGDCFSSRAIELLDLCAKPYAKNLQGIVKSQTETFKLENRFTRDFSPIEVYITEPKAENASLIAYLKGQTNTLKL